MIRFIADIFKDRQGRALPYIKEIRKLDQLTIVRLKGEIDSETIPVISDNIDGQAKYLDRNILLDFEDVTNVDSSTLAYIITLLDKLQKHHRKLGVINTNSLLDNYLSIEKVDSVIHKYKDENEALKELS